MPELPEVEIVRRGIEKAVRGLVIEKIQINRFDLRRPIPENFSKKHIGARMKDIKRRGKYIIAALDNGNVFILHLGMSGRIRIFGPDEKPDSQKHDHAVFKFVGGTQIIFNDPRRFGMLYDAALESWRDESPFNAMGPEPLGNDFSGPVLAAALKSRSGAIKTALLDQKLVTGIGNIYACEALYEAAIDPLRAANSLNSAECEALASSLKNVLNKALESGGSSLRDYRHTDGKLGYFQHFFSVYDREGQACQNAACGGHVQRIVQAGRSTFFCPRCQI